MSLSLVSCVFYVPTLLAGLTDIDVLHIALGCRIALGHIHDFAATFPYT